MRSECVVGLQSGFADAEVLAGDWLDFFFDDVWCVLRVLRGRWLGRSVRRTCNRVWGCVWDGEIDDTETEGRKSEKV